jgi:hypothetical protein
VCHANKCKDFIKDFIGKKSKSKHYTKKATVGTGVDQIDTSVTTNTHKIVFEIAMLSAWHTHVIHNGNPE